MKEFSKEALDELQFWAKTHAADNDTQDTATTLAVLAAALGSTPDELATAAGLAMASQGRADSDELGRALGSLLLGAQLSPEAALEVLEDAVSKMQGFIAHQGSSRRTA